MKISMQMTVTDLIRTLRWQAIELAEQVIEERADTARNLPKTNAKRQSEARS